MSYERRPNSGAVVALSVLVRVKPVGVVLKVPASEASVDGRGAR